MTNKQRKAFCRIWAGSIILFSDFGFDDVEDIKLDDLDKLDEPRNVISIKLLKSDPSFSNTKDIYEYVLKNY